MRNLPEVKVIVDDKVDREGYIDLKTWQEKANSQDLYYLYLEEITNNTHYQFHDLFFTLHYKQYSARFFRQELLKNFRELIAQQMTLEDIRARAARVDAEEEQAKADVKAMIAQLRTTVSKEK